MKKIVKTEGIITNLFGPTADITDPKLRNTKAGNYAFVMVKYQGKMVTSKNTIAVSASTMNGHRVNVWYREGNPKKVYRNPISAFLLA